tara:strand:- start:240 stop:380 length:141 start_codon:yes stop_codon:yes gene_type:complete
MIHEKVKENRIIQVKLYEPRNILVTQEGSGNGGSICIYGLKVLDQK